MRLWARYADDIGAIEVLLIDYLAMLVTQFIGSRDMEIYIDSDFDIPTV